MNLILQAIEHYGFNARRLTETDFFAICETERIAVLEREVPAAFTMSLLGTRTIVLRRRAKGLHRTFEMFHELAHALAHGGKSATNAFFFGLNESRAETEADAVATIALIPFADLAGYQFLDENPTRFGRQLWRDRQRIAFLYGL